MLLPLDVEEYLSLLYATKSWGSTSLEVVKMYEGLWLP